MRLHRFYISEKVGNKTEIILDNSDVVHQIRKVFRLKKDDLLIIFDGSGSDYTCVIDDFRGETIVLGIRESSKSRFMPSRELVLCMSIVKKDTFEWIVEKATELGVTKIIPIISERTEKKSINEDRLNKIAIEASEQSGRGSVPEIGEVVSLMQLIEQIHTRVETSVIAFHTDGSAWSRVGLDQAEPLYCFIGPEGGWSPDEVALFHDNKIPVRSIGKQVLRAETAVVASLALVMLG